MRSLVGGYSDRPAVWLGNWDVQRPAGMTAEPHGCGRIALDSTAANVLSAREHLERQDRLPLDELIELNQPLCQGDLLKEQLRGILRDPWRDFGVLRDRLHGRIVATLGSGLPEFQPVALRLAEHLDAVIAGHQHDVPLGLVEAINRKIAALRYQARGDRDPESFKLKIFQRCSLPDNPWAHIVL